MWIGFVFEKRRIYYSGKLNPWGKFEDPQRFIKNEEKVQAFSRKTCPTSPRFTVM